ncbi:MAG: pseudouridine synthase [Bacteroidia bacterium]|nr:MAG: pseudouridine synthase [Bacteroidia bacterium]
MSKQPKRDNKIKDPELIRLNKYIANAGICSRREADKLIINGLVKVNGKVATEVGSKVKRLDTVTVRNKKIKPERLVYVLLNKPKGYITTVSDEKNRKTVLDFFKGRIEERIYPVGRLDKNSTGVLLLTNDGDLTKKLTHPSYNKKKIYRVDLDTDFKKKDLEHLLRGIELEDGLMTFDELAFPDPENKKILGVEIHSGRNRIIRRAFEQLGYKVLRLDRVYFAGLTKKNLKRGRWRFLTEREISNLKRGSYK